MTEAQKTTVELAQETLLRLAQLTMGYNRLLYLCPGALMSQRPLNQPTWQLGPTFGASGEEDRLEIAALLKFRGANAPVDDIREHYTAVLLLWCEYMTYAEANP